MKNMFRILFATMLAIGMCLTADGAVHNHKGRTHRHAHRHALCVRYSPAIVSVVRVYGAAAPINGNERWAVASRYLEQHRSLSAGKYSALTGLTVRRAAAELAMFARSGRLVQTTIGKGRLAYVKPQNVVRR